MISRKRFRKTEFINKVVEVLKTPDTYFEDDVNSVLATDAIISMGFKVNEPLSVEAENSRRTLRMHTVFSNDVGVNLIMETHPKEKYYVFVAVY